MPRPGTETPVFPIALKQLGELAWGFGEGQLLCPHHQNPSNLHIHSIHLNAKSPSPGFSGLPWGFTCGQGEGRSLDQEQEAPPPPPSSYLAVQVQAAGWAQVT